jgi:hypothetical protein
MGDELYAWTANVIETLRLITLKESYLSFINRNIES